MRLAWRLGTVNNVLISEIVDSKNLFSESCVWAAVRLLPNPSIFPLCNPMVTLPIFTNYTSASFVSLPLKRKQVMLVNSPFKR
jgi:hypothetical protein